MAFIQLAISLIVLGFLYRKMVLHVFLGDKNTSSDLAALGHLPLKGKANWRKASPWGEAGTRSVTDEG